MESVSNWVTAHWLQLIESCGIIGGLIFTGLSFRRDTRARRTSDLLALQDQHRELWAEFRQRPELSRALAAEVDFIKPITEAEEKFINEVIVHYTMGWLLARDGSLVTIKALRSDVQSFFQLPLVKKVWEQTKSARDKRFRKFVDACLRSARKRSR